MSRHYRPIDPGALRGWLTEAILARSTDGVPLRVAIDGPGGADPDGLATALVEPLRVRGRDAVLVAADSFWRDASLRLEFGRHDVDSYLSWLDGAALRREVLAPLGPGGSRQYLPSLRDPVSNRATRQAARTATPTTVLIVHGSLLLGLGLPFDLTVHLELSPAGRTRRTPQAEAWTLPAYDRYDAEVSPTVQADIVVKLDDPRHPAVAKREPDK